MALPINRITEPNAVNVDADLYPEWRVQALFQVWLEFYFSGAAFTTRAAGGGTEQRTFHACAVDFQEAGAPDAEDDDGGRTPQDRPIIHGILPDQRSRAYQHSETEHGEDLDWTLNLMVKVPKNLTTTGSQAAEPKWLCREAADQLAWLLRSCERAALSEHGIHNLTLRSGPTLLSSGPWFIRILVVSLRSRRLTPRL
jgi:hypothetical protein